MSKVSVVEDKMYTHPLTPRDVANVVEQVMRGLFKLTSDVDLRQFVGKEGNARVRIDKTDSGFRIVITIENTKIVLEQI